MTDTKVIGPDGKEYPGGDLEPLLMCGYCKQLKPISAFNFAAKNTTRLQRDHKCRDCKAEIGRKYRSGVRTPDPRTVARNARRAKIPTLLDQNYSPAEIAEMLGVATSTISTDLREMGLGGKQRDYIKATGAAPPKNNVTVADNAITRLAEMASLIHDGKRIILQLEGLPISPEMAARWEQDLVHVGRALRYLRSHAKKGNT